MSYHSSTKKFGKFQLFFGLHLLSDKKMDTRGLNDLFFGFHLILGKTWTFANIITLKEPVLLLRCENIVTLFFKKIQKVVGYQYYLCMIFP